MSRVPGSECSVCGIQLKKIPVGRYSNGCLGWCSSVCTSLANVLNWVLETLQPWLIRDNCGRYCMIEAIKALVCL